MLLNCGVGEDSWESLGLQGDQTSPKGNQLWMFIGRTDAEAEIPIVWPPDAKNSLIGKDPDARKDWRQEEKGTTEDEMDNINNSMDMSWWTSSGSWWWTGKPGILQSLEVKRVRPNWATELNWTVCTLSHFIPIRLFVTPWTITRQASLSMGFPRQEY